MEVLLVDDEHLALQELAYLLSQEEPSIVIHQAQSIQDALGILISNSIDVAFLDIQMNEESGMDLAKMIQGMKQPPLIVFATAFDHYALEAFQLDAVDYLVKPFKQSDVSRIYHKLGQLLTQRNFEAAPKTNQPLPVATDDRIILVELHQILYLTAVGGLVEVHLQGQVLETKETLKSLKDKLPGRLFYQVHRSYIIHRQAIQEIQPWFNHTFQLTMTNGDKVPVSRSNVNDFKKQFGL